MFFKGLISSYNIRGNVPLKDVTWYNFRHLFFKKITDKVRQKNKVML